MTEQGSLKDADVRMPIARVVRVNLHMGRGGKVYLAVVARTWQGAYWSDRRLLGTPLEGSWDVSDQAAIMRAAAAALAAVSDRLSVPPAPAGPAPLEGPRGDR